MRNADVTTMEFLRQSAPDLAGALETLFGDQSSGRVLGSQERELILMGLCAIHGTEADVLEHGRKALEAGASAQAAIEVVLTTAISRGPRALEASRVLLSTLPHSGPPQQKPATPTRPLEYFESEFGSLPDWVRRLAEFSPIALECYAILRQGLLADGAVPRRVKELLTMSLNAIDGSSGGIKSHAVAAVKHGASKEEILDALLQGLRVGGIIAWINGVAALHDLLVPRQP